MLCFSLLVLSCIYLSSILVSVFLVLCFMIKDYPFPALLSVLMIMTTISGLTSINKSLTTRLLPASHFCTLQHVWKKRHQWKAHTLLGAVKSANQAHSAAHHDGDVGKKAQCTALVNYQVLMLLFTDSLQEFGPSA